MSAARSDAHSLIIAFARDPDFRNHTAGTKKMAAAQQERARLLKDKDVRGPRLVSMLAEATADAPNRLVLEMARLRNLRDNELEGAKFLGRQLLKFLRPPDETGPED